MRAFALLPLLLLLGVSAPLSTAASSDPLQIEQRQTFVVQADLGHGQALIASGVLVSRDATTLTIATSPWILKSHKAPIVLDQSRMSYYHVLDGQLSKRADISYIRVAAQSAFQVEPPLTARAYPGEPVWIWGHPDGGFWVMSTGTIAEVTGSGAQIDCDTCAPGDGGAGVFDGFGRLVGVLNEKHSVTLANVVLTEANYFASANSVPIGAFASK
jgi:hypothetical protein